jgi:hypothetical protein
LHEHTRRDWIMPWSTDTSRGTDMAHVTHAAAHWPRRTRRPHQYLHVLERRRMNRVQRCAACCSRRARRCNESRARR